MEKRMIAETVRLIQQKGFTFTMDDLAKSLATSKRTLYEFYPSKNKLVEAVIAQFIAEMKKSEAEIYGNEELDALEKVKRILIGLPKEMELLNMGLLNELKKYYYDAWLTLDTFMKDEWTIILELLDNCHKQNMIRKVNTSLFIQMYLGSINQVYDPDYPLKNQMTTGETLESIVDILFEGICRKEK
ncbi:TetR/AcrR family transcriptional regulator [Bacillus atrophaeus]|uniref:TetR/AcrR family transcriptional regulator n=1 Tax=Bacillus atrophaeus TaxID=1452 RepID=UPI00227EB722|nr:TetR/AcrR family transcriptional regulator [Bacillus atrophaeus]MCY8467171.1 TetR/AcrR family transcriptional regulator [Bacillus atrophaeus]MCY8477734.1 TetR/AcrR family transcriptional regulator [Bacillus atrophaeus]MCY8960702.1 TetR/AcrR family transcriptional regulator [Bacillus atrophaeus]MCY8962393.1 TetR/AcrR family transcriptional regulator [Bacillus atrophaeus]MCY9438802.1 TetR/AcrR family transcriptional regulator [Bacillus atrophaeus]